MSKELRTGLLVAISLSVFFIGFYFLKGASLFSKNKEYYCFFPNVDGLQNSANVQVRGMSVGHISDMRLVDSGVMVTVIISKSVDLPEGTIATLESTDLLNTKVLNLELGRGPGALPAGAQLPGRKKGGLAESISSELTPRLQQLKVTITAFDSVLAGVNALVNAENQRTITAAIQSVKVTADNLAALTGTLNKEGEEITAIIHNANAFTTTLAQSKDTIKQILTNFNTLSRQMANAPIQKTVADLQNTVSQFKGIAEKINSGQGSLGLLINSKDLHDNLNHSLNTLNKLMGDIKDHPARYINVTIFGKKKN